MDKKQQITILRREHASAVGRFDFDRAEFIKTQITRLRAEITRESQTDKTAMLSFDIAGHKERILADSARVDTHLLQKRIELQQRFHLRYSKLQELQTQAANDLSLQYTLALERELSRPVPEADQRLREAKALARADEYAPARVAHQQAAQIREGAQAERRRACAEIFARNHAQLSERHDRELELLAEKQNAALAELEKRRSGHRELVSTRMRTSEIKHTTAANRMSASAASNRAGRAPSRSSRNALLA
jgi:hypothetical protein